MQKMMTLRKTLTLCADSALAREFSEEAQQQADGGSDSESDSDEEDAGFVLVEQQPYVFKKMVDQLLTPNVVSCSTAITACEKGSQWQRALGILQEMAHPEFSIA